MYERCLTEAERVLASSSQVTLPIKDLWNQVRVRCKAVGSVTPTLADFTAMLEGDPRFELLQSQPEESETERDIFEEEGEMGSLDIHVEDKVKLRRIKIVRVEDEEDESPGTKVRGLSTTASVSAKHRPSTKSGSKPKVRARPGAKTIRPPKQKASKARKKKR